MQLGRPLEDSPRVFVLSHHFLQLLQLSLHGLREVLEVLGHSEREDVFEKILEASLYFLVLFLALEVGEAEPVLLSLVALVLLVGSEESLPVEPVAVLLEVLGLLLRSGQLHLVLLLQEGQDVGRGFDLEVEVLEGADLYVLHREGLVNLLVELGCSDLVFD